MQSTKPLTHVLWLQRWEAGKFREWLPVGKGRVEKDPSGNILVENFQHLTSIGGWNGYTMLLPIGVMPPDPAPQRPATSGGAKSQDEVA
ncbi:hypothetical protein [Acidicapsa acidisoli]|uniref:hypothetical protein n=1 Tax=Acidicapsa acidisoli TaxID=1615681 RepID=UPI0021DFBE87|nr:hypothetical protein [Acidicapsa acidisoli]